MAKIELGSDHHKASQTAVDLAMVVCDLEEQKVEILRVLEGLVEIIDAAGLLNLSNGVQLGPTVRYVKAADRMTEARDIIAAAKTGE